MIIKNMFNNILVLAEISLRRFEIFKKVLGAYISIIFFLLAINYTNLFFGNILYLGFCIVGSILALIFAFTRFEKILSIVLVIFLMVILNYNLAILRVIPGYLGFYLLYVFLSSFNKESWDKNKFTTLIFMLVISFTYTYSGYIKLTDSHWLHGTAMQSLSSNPRFEDITKIINNGPWSILINYLVIIIEILFFPLFWFKTTRKFATYSILTLFTFMFIFMKIKFILGTMLFFLIFIDNRLLKNFN